MGEVYLAQDTRLNRRVALKVLSRELTDQDSLRRFIQEAKAVSALNHPNILTIYEIDEIDSQQFIATEFIEGETLRNRIRLSRFTPAEAMDVGVQIANALCAAHSVGIIHRDIKPENVMLRNDGIVKVLDFGLAKITRDWEPAVIDCDAETQAFFDTQPGIIMGTAKYMSPEQARGFELDARTDIWSLGCILYEMVTGQHPFVAASAADVLSGILTNEPAPLVSHISTVPRELERIVQRSMRKDREQRYQTSKELLIDLKDLKSELEAQSKNEISLRESGSDITPVPAKSIAVLYFENLNQEKESDYFCAGITEDIITDLSKIHGLKIVSRTDVLPFRNKGVNIKQVGEALRVNYILEGSVRTAGNRIRITTQLIDVRDGYHLWAERFDRMVDDIFDLQNEVSEKIVSALKISLSDSEKQLLAKKPTDDLRAYDFYMQGRELLSLKGKRNTERAIQMFENAVGLDESFAAAYAALAEAYCHMYEWYDGNSAWLTNAIEMNQKTLTLDPSSLEAQFGIAMVYFHHRRLAEAKRAFEKIIRHHSEFFPGHLRLGMIAELSGDLEAALKHYSRAAELKPFDEDSWRFLAGVHRKLGNSELAEQAALKVIEVTSRKLEASLDDITVMSRLAEAYARFGAAEEAHSALRRVFEVEPDDGLAVYNAACAYALLGETESAMVALRRAFINGFRTVAHWAKTDNAFDLIRDEREFQQLLAELAI